MFFITRMLLLVSRLFQSHSPDYKFESLRSCMEISNNTGGGSKFYMAMTQSYRQIYCGGPILKAVQQAGLFKDSKHFVDMALRFDPLTTLKHFYDMTVEERKDKEQLQRFVDLHFMPPDSNHVTFQIQYDVFENPDRYSLLYVAHPFIVPGGRFREFYYWDSYWIMKGLLYSEMYTTVKGMIRNYGDLVQHIGFVPNGGRIYYLLRSQPPFLIPMVYDYYQETGDFDFLCEIMPSLLDEFNFWNEHRTVKLKGGSSIYQYKVDMKVPRPESYREDVEIAKNLTLEDRERMFANIASAAETGWDFSSRWFSHEGVQADKLASIRTQDIIPVDLNAFMCMNALLLAKLLDIEGYHPRQEYLKYMQLHRDMKELLEEVHWNETDGVWYDYDVTSKQHIVNYYVSNAVPIFTGCYDHEIKTIRVYQYMQRVGALRTSLGIPTSFIDSKQQWDNTNSWPPMMHMLIEGFRHSKVPAMRLFGKQLAEQWLSMAYNTFQATSNMFEKYSTADGQGGEGGEYELQTGFGWTNGVVLDLLAKYGKEAVYEPKVASQDKPEQFPQPLKINIEPIKEEAPVKKVVELDTTPQVPPGVPGTPLAEVAPNAPTAAPPVPPPKLGSPKIQSQGAPGSDTLIPAESLAKKVQEMSTKSIIDLKDLMNMTDKDLILLLDAVEETQLPPDERP